MPKKNQIETHCTACNLQFFRTPSQLKKSKLPFCSRSCSATYYNTTINPRQERVCELCNSKFIPPTINSSKVRCRNCVKESAEEKHRILLNTPIKDFFVKTKHLHPSHKLNKIRTLCRRWNQDLTKNGCQVCGYKHHVEFAHIKPLSSFPETTTIGEVNSPDNIYILCPNHHWEFDNGVLIAIPTRI